MWDSPKSKTRACSMPPHEKSVQNKEVLTYLLETAFEKPLEALFFQLHSMNGFQLVARPLSPRFGYLTVTMAQTVVVQLRRRL